MSKKMRPRVKNDDLPDSAECMWCGNLFCTCKTLDQQFKELIDACKTCEKCGNVFCTCDTKTTKESNKPKYIKCKHCESKIKPDYWKLMIYNRIEKTVSIKCPVCDNLQEMTFSELEKYDIYDY